MQEGATLLFTPPQWGGDKVKAKEMLEKAAAKYETFMLVPVSILTGAKRPMRCFWKWQISDGPHSGHCLLLQENFTKRLSTLTYGRPNSTLCHHQPICD